jgi:hypothetical protein
VIEGGGRPLTARLCVGSALPKICAPKESIVLIDERTKDTCARPARQAVEGLARAIGYDGSLGDEDATLH